MIVVIGWRGEQQEAPWDEVQSDNHGAGRGGKQQSYQEPLKIFFFFLSNLFRARVSSSVL